MVSVDTEQGEELEGVERAGLDVGLAVDGATLPTCLSLLSLDAGAPLMYLVPSALMTTSWVS